MDRLPRSRGDSGRLRGSEPEPEAIELVGEAAKQDPGGRRYLRTLRLECAEIDGAKPRS